MQRSITTFGQQRITVDGRVVLWTAPVAQRLFYLLLAHPDGTTRNALIHQMGVVENSFRVIQHRLRQALGHQDAVMEREGRYFLAPAYYQNVDYLLFEDALRRAKCAGDREQRLRHLYEAMILYEGDFLPDYTDDWAEEIRTTLRAAYVRARMEAASLHCAAVECHSAVRNLATGLASDPLGGEQFHRNLMTCLCSLDRADDATSHYRRFLGFIQSEVGDMPACATMQLAVQIRDDLPHAALSIGSHLPCQRRLLYGRSPVNETPHHLDLAHLEHEVQRGKQMLTLLQKMTSARDWKSLACCVQHFLSTHIGTPYVWLCPYCPSVPAAQEFKPEDLDGAGWPAQVTVAFQAMDSAAPSATDGDRSKSSDVEATIYLIGPTHQPPLARLYIARQDESHKLVSSDTELLAQVVSALTDVLSQSRWLNR